MGIIIDDQTLNGNHQPPYLMEATLDEMLGHTVLYVNGFTERAFVDITSVSRVLAYIEKFLQLHHTDPQNNFKLQFHQPHSVNVDSSLIKYLNKLLQRQLSVDCLVDNNSQLEIMPVHFS